MKFLTYTHHDTASVGIIGTNTEKVVPAAALGLPADDMTHLIEVLSSQTPESLLYQVDAADGVSLSDCRLLAPIRHPRQDIVCLGVNYYEHREETIASNIKYDETLTKPIYFSKRVNEAVDPDSFIQSHSDFVTELDYEVELGVILGKDARNVAAEDVKDYIFGYTILNDVSARDLQSAHQQWYFGKSLDGFTPMGPWIVTRDTFSWLPALDIRSYVNGELRQHNNTSHMMTTIDRAVAQLSRGMTLKAGTIIASGTPSGVGMAFTPPKYLKPGDVVRCEIEGIGALENTVQ